MNGYVCARAWFDFCFENPRLIKPLHHAIIHWIFEKANESEWSWEFQLPTVEACTILGITDRDTYQKGLKDLIGFGAIRITQESQGRYVARWVTLDNCPIYLPNKSAGSRVGNGVGSPVGTRGGSTIGNMVGTTPNKKTIETKETLKTEETFETGIDADRLSAEIISDLGSSETVGTPSKVAPKVSPKFNALDVPLPHGADFAAAWKDWVIHRREKKSPLTELSVRKQLELCTCYSEKVAIEIILTSITSGYQGLFPPKQSGNGKSYQELHRNDSPTGTGVSSRLQSAWELLAESRKAHAS